MKELIKKLVEAYGPSGSESGVSSIIRSLIEKHVDEIVTDNIGNLICLKKASKGFNPAGRTIKKVMFCAHMDEIGFVITYIDEKGFLRFSNVGGVRPHGLVGGRVRFANGAVGVISIEKAEDLKDPKFNKMFIDIGASNKEEAERIVEVGSFACYDRNFVDMGNRLVSKAMDDRIACAALIAAAKSIDKISNDIYFVFSTQEELGLRGSKVGAFLIDPDIGIACDVTGWGDTPEVEHFNVELGKGPAVKIKDASLISHIGIKNLMIDVAERNNIPYQMEVLEWGGTDAGAISLNRSGVPSGAVSIPCRYVHTASEMVDYRDFCETVKLLTALANESFDNI